MFVLLGNYWAVNQVITKGLHNSDEEAMQFTTRLMDKLEQVRWSDTPTAVQPHLTHAVINSSKMKTRTTKRSPITL